MVFCYIVFLCYNEYIKFCEREVLPVNLKKTGINRKEQQQMVDDMYHCCRFCHHYVNGKCFNQNMMESFCDSPSSVYKVAEEGRLSAVLEETFHSVKKNTVVEEIVTLLRDYKLSEKRVKEVKDSLVNSIDQWFDFEVKDKIDEEVSELYQDAVENMTEVDGVEIINPSEHYCKDWC